MKNEVRFDRGEFTADVADRQPGQPVKGVVRITRTGVFPYADRDGKTIMERRSAKEVFKKKSLDSAKGMAVQVGHNAMLTPANMSKFKAGHCGDDIGVDAPFVTLPVTLDTSESIAAYDAGMREFSCGYYLNLAKAPPGARDDDGTPFDYDQTDIDYNHLALCDQARLGPEMRFIGDSGGRFDSENFHYAIRHGDAPTSQQENDMNMVKIILDSANSLSYDAAPEVKAHLDRQIAEVARLQAALDTANREKGTAIAEKDTLTVQLQAEKDAHDATKTGFATTLQDAVKDRLHLKVVAKAVLDEEEFKKFDTMENDAVRKAVVIKKLPGLTLDGKDAAYIKTSFDTLVAGMTDLEQEDESDPTLKALRIAGGDANPTTKSADKAYDTYAETRKKLHKKKDKNAE